MFSAGFPTVAYAQIGVAAPGMTIHTGTRICALGATGYIGGAEYGVTAAHCYEEGKTVYSAGGRVIGHYEQAFGSDASIADMGFALIRLSPDTIMQAFLPGKIRINTADSAPYVGEEVCHIGTGTGHTCGHITSVGNGHFIADFPSEKGDSGGIVYHRAADNRVDFLGILIGSIEGSGALIESAQYLRDSINSHAGGSEPFQWYTE